MSQWPITFRNENIHTSTLKIFHHYAAILLFRVVWANALNFRFALILMKFAKLGCFVSLIEMAKTEAVATFLVHFILY